MDSLVPITMLPPRSFVLIVGAGSAGVAAALAAARRDVPVVLVEPHVLGGNSTGGGINTWEPAIGGPGLPYEFYRKLSDYPKAVALSRSIKEWTSEEPWSSSSIYSDPDGSEKGYYKTLRRAGRALKNLRRVTFEPEILSQVMGEALDKTGKVHCLIGWRFLECTVSNRRLDRIVVSDGTRTFQLRPGIVVDATAQIHLAASAGCQTSLGAESRDYYGEPSAPERAREQINGVTLCFRVRSRGHRAVDPLPEGITGAHYPSNYSITEYPNGDLNINALPLMEGMEYQRMEPMRARQELLSRLHRTWAWLQAEKGFDGHEMAIVFPLVGVREGPRLVGRHVLTETEIRRGCSHQGNSESWIALGDHALDVHGEGHICRELEEPYGIPYQCLLPRELDNLAVACRGASFSHIAGSSCRLSRTMIGLGHAAGIACALAMSNETPLMEIDPVAIQKQLADDNVTLDPNDSRFPTD